MRVWVVGEARMWSSGEGGLRILGLVGLDLLSPFPLGPLSPRARLRMALASPPIIFPLHFCFPFVFHILREKRTWVIRFPWNSYLATGRWVLH